jgi:hypothetical protein
MAGVNAVANMWTCERCPTNATDPAGGNCKPAGEPTTFYDALMMRRG